MRKLCAAAAAILGCLGPFVRPAHGAGERNPPAVVLRASEYVDDFIQRFSNVVAEERYVQETDYPPRRREVVSDFLLVSAPGSLGRFQFRDVIAVDGAPVADRHERLTRLFLEAPADALERAKDMAREGERYNLGSYGTLNQPLLAVGFLQSRYVNRFRYTVGGLERHGDVTVRYVAFEESTRPTIVKSAASHRDFPSRGYFLLDEPTGRVVTTELDLDGGTPPSRIVTSFRYDDTLRTIVPVEMRDPLGVATYGRFRRFMVTTKESVR